MEKRILLERCFGYREFRDGQEKLIDGVLSGRDVFGIMPTGGGKSICYQLPALMLPGITFVVSPLISLMQDQVMALKAAGIPAAFINSSLNAAQMRAVFRNLRNGAYKIVYIAPERLDYPGFVEFSGSLPISMIAVDEAHCISQWGQDFRPSYLRIVRFIQALGHRPVVSAFTATATAQVREDVERILELQNPVRVVTGFDRPNLSFEVRTPNGKDGELLRLMVSRREKSGIIYCATRKKVEDVCSLLQEKGYAATRYHAGLEEQERRENQEAFIRDDASVMVATNAFGMGIDKSNVNYVIHYNMPKSMEAYYQEAGRAGRDGTAAECILLYSKGDVATAEFLIQNSSENEELDPAQREQIRQQDLARLSMMVAYCKTKDCLRGFILDYFGQKHPEACGNCGNCRENFVPKDITLQSQMILSCVRRIYDKLGYYMGADIVARVLQGSKEKRVLELDLNTLSTYGLMKTTGRTEIRAMIDHLEMEGYLATEPEYKTLRLTEKASRILYQGQQVEMLVREEQIQKPEGKDFASEEWGELYEALRELRGEIARESGIAAYMVFSNATLEDMARKQPKNISQFKRVSGVGEMKANWYGKEFLKCIREYKNGS